MNVCKVSPLKLSMRRIRDPLVDISIVLPSGLNLRPVHSTSLSTKKIFLEIEVVLNSKLTTILTVHNDNFDSDVLHGCHPAVKWSYSALIGDRDLMGGRRTYGDPDV